LQYNQHLGKTLLLPVEEPKSILDQVIKETILRKRPENASDEYVRNVSYVIYFRLFPNLIFAARERR